MQGGGRCGVAGNDHTLDAASQQMIDDGETAGSHLVEAALAIGGPRLICEVDHGFAR